MKPIGSPSADLVVVGLGPAGRSLVHRASNAGIDVLGVDPHPNRVWTPTYSAWADELPDWLPASVVATSTTHPAAWTTRRQSIGRTYCVLNTGALQQALEVKPSDIVAANASTIRENVVTLADGTIVRGRTVVDARGSVGIIGLAEQTAYGIVVDRAVGETLLEGEGAWFMDWRPDNGSDSADTPSFLYAVALDENRILLEETCLVGTPALDPAVLRDRLVERLRRRGFEPTGAEAVERVKFAVQPPPRDRADHGVRRFGARSPLMHPATGYSVAASLATTDAFLDAVTTGRSPVTPSIWAVQRLRNLGLRTALNLEARQIPHFFASFFALPVPLQTAYLSGRSDLRGTLSAMTRMFPTLPPSARLAIARTVVGR
ncbi:lycopene cyclase family protein [Rhodococcoides kyotonense]|uniref:Lycopene beta-cyclase n=1 Tax=Rhodococcoides kyotonense TaxID=398843 RepID=A0A239CNN4_9NOCA|nr:lycopene cyclase family protein [Rhodococcus kyotonensis]SNS21750.1 lycopene beta-cyclase [Rhodococcus kyotonensis]